ncbi:hypothetical protein [Mucilaginibacter myungsuensis]|uniref:Uncharacterized protein n=1 Tax=Mucilaginibacter myungsuensis TaxID=649104 RepID=A0A929PVN4_9SPHI|nr:hypothetical protein [Mucilaginibacter myungsuensis]MBE9661206.1 hypothetical protein [Mucilaginibacter myungsuensis]MDN3597351.1 hypothetical protein [Mucilaginibacter myungsuensis]
MKIITTQTLLIGTVLLPLLSVAQRLPKIQETGLRAPANIKIDGRATEWGDKFQAYNNSTQVFYTLANDKDNLYLVVQATDQMVGRKIIAGGITFKILTADKGTILVTYPLFSSKNWPVIGLRDKADLLKEPAKNAARIDSFKLAANQQFSLRSKEIKITGGKGLSDSLLSVYNDEGIKVAAEFDQKLNYTYELAIPLKYLDLHGNAFTYTLQLNGSSFAEGNTIEDIEGGTRVNGISGKLVPMADMQFMRYPTNCSGKYTLVK